MTAPEDFEKQFNELIAHRAARLLRVATCVQQQCADEKQMTRPMLGEILTHSALMEELLDTYGARSNQKWYGFRSIVAALKLFAVVSYELLHIEHAWPAYHLLPIEGAFGSDTVEALGFCKTVVRAAATRLLEEASQRQIPIPQDIPQACEYEEHYPPGRLPHDRASRQMESVSQTVTLLATAYLNGAAESHILHPDLTRSIRPEQFAAFAQESATEENLREIKFRFHNLQSLYDTYVSQTDTEGLDQELPTLRGHISIIYHLMKLATDLAHHYERHVSRRSGTVIHNDRRLVDSDLLLKYLIQYAVRYAGLYLAAAQKLCQDMLKRYAEVGRIEVNVPRYRGFHVRPCTLIARLVKHYGSEVKMELQGQTYNAGAPLDMFRANEMINAEKRRIVAQEIDRLNLVQEERTDRPLEEVIRGVVLTLAEHGKLVIYEQPLQLTNPVKRKDGLMLAQVIEEIGRLQAMGKIEIDTEVPVAFVGDKRVLADIKILSDAGYGEDRFGNNVPLPDTLAYLRH